MTTVVAVVSLAGCVSLSSYDQLLLGEGAETVRMLEADCGSGWQELSVAPADLDIVNSEGFDLLSWNVFKGRREQWAEDFKSLVTDRDLVLLQEAHLTPSFREALEASGLHWLMVRAFDYDGAETGVLTAGMVSASAACLNRIAEPLIRVPKSALFTRYRLTGSSEELLLINLHGVNFMFGTTGFETQLDALAEVIAAHRGPMILAGDFNTWNGARDDILRRFAVKLGLMSLRFADDERSRHFGAAVDHVFYRGLDILAAKSVQVESSDHHPILASFRLSNERQKGAVR
jgi:endonuclease/exonuclease/phosphatase (EEP) superfamily protein YafD